MAVPAEQLTPAEPAPYVPEQGQVAIRDADGSIWKIPQENLEAAQGQGATLASEADYVSRKMGQPLAQTSAALIGVGRGLTSVSPVSFDQAMIEGSRFLGGDSEAEDTRHALNLAKEAHPTASLTGEVAGMALPMFFGGGAGVAGKVAQGETLLARAAQRVAQAAPRAIGEGVGIGLNQQSAEDALGNHKLVAENYLTSGFKGGAVGLLLGGGLHAGMGAAGDLAGKGTRKATEFFGRGVAHEAQEDAQVAAEKLYAPKPAGPFAVDAVSDLDAGLAGGLPKAEKPFVFGQKTHEVGLDEKGLEQAFAGVPAGEKPLRVGVSEHLRVSADPDEGIIGSFAHAHEEVPNIFQPGKLGKDAEEAPVFFRQRGHGNDVTEHPTFAVAPRREAFIDDAESAFANREKAGDPLEISRKKTGARPVLLDEGIGGSSPGAEVHPLRFGRNPEAVRAETTAARESQLAQEAQAASAPRSLAERARAASDEQAYLATGAKMGDIRKLGADAEAQRIARERIGATLKREVGLGAFESQESFAKKIADRTREVGKSLRPMYAELDKAAARPSLDAIAERFNSEVRGPAARGLFGTEELGMAEHALESLQGKGDVNFSRLFDLRRDLDGKLTTHFARNRGMPVPPGEQALRGLRDIVQEELELSGARASAELGTNTIDKIKLTNLLYKDLKAAKDVSTKEAARGAGNAKYSLSDMLAMTAALASGHVLGGVVPIANYVRKNFGNQVASYALDKVSRLTALQTSSSKIDTALSQGAKAFVTGASARGTRDGALLTSAEVREIRAASQNTQAVQKNISAALGDLQQYAPKVAAEVSLSAARTAAYLARVLPKERSAPNPFFKSKADQNRPMSDSELIRATAQVEVAKDPTIVLDRIRQGRLTRDHVVALRATNPETYLKIRKYLTDHAEDLKDDLTVQQAVALSVLFQTAIHPSMLPSNVKAFQASFVGGNQAPKGGGAGAAMAPSTAQMAAGPIKGGGTRATFFDTLEKPQGHK